MITTRTCRITVGAVALAFLACTQAQAQTPHPAESWEFALEGGYLAKIRNNSPHDYRIAPLNLAWRSPATRELWNSPDGSRLVLRHRLAFVAERIIRGPEDRYVAFSAAPSLELWSADRRTAGFFEIGGGAGFIDSRGVTGGQGQDFTFNWYTQGGVRHQLYDDLALTTSLYFTHHSNLGMTDPNPGIDVLGLNVGLVWSIR